jgi:mono/diheme cytochrome c family protein
MRGAARALILAGFLAVSAAGGAAWAADAARGLALATQWCAQCHGLRPNEASTIPAATSFSEIAARAATTEMALRVFLRTSHPTMPNIILERDDLDDIVGYILSLRPAR